MKDPQTPSNLNLHWQALIKQWQASGLSGSQFCIQQDLVYHQFMYWKQKFSKQTPIAKSSSGNGFARVIAQPNTSESGLSIVLPNGVEIRNIGPANIDLVNQLLERL